MSYPQQGGQYPPQQNPNVVYPPQQGGQYPPQQGGQYPQTTGSYPPQQPTTGGYPPQQGVQYPQQTGAYNPQQGSYGSTGSYPPQQGTTGSYPQTTGSYPQQTTGGYPPQQGGQYSQTTGPYNPQGGQQTGGYTQQPTTGGYPQQTGAYNPQQGYGQQPQQGSYAQFNQGNQYGSAPQNVDPQIQTWFNQVDTDRSGHISVQELINALAYGGFSQFSQQAATDLLRKFNVSGNGQLSLSEFQHLATFLNTMKRSFQQADTNNSQSLDYQEVGRALQQSGMQFDQNLLSRVVSKFDRNKNGSLGLDEFIELSIMISTARDVFNTNDYNRSGTVPMTFDMFLNSVVAIKFGIGN